MDNQLKKLTAEIKAAFVEALGKKEFAETVAATKAASDTGTFEVIISTADRDRQGDIVMQDGWNLDNYKANPVVLWAHDYYQLPIGVCDSIEVKDGKLVAKGRFAAHDFAQSVRALYDAGMLRATSVGFIPTEYDGSIIIKAELLEFSFVPVPANPMALSLAAEKKLDVVQMFVKGFLTKEVAEQPAEPAATEPQATEPAAVEPEAPAAPADEEPAPASEPSATETTTTAPPAEPTDGTNAAGGDDQTASPQPEVETPAEGGEGASEVGQKAADGDEEQEETDELAAFMQLQTALQSVQSAAASDTISLDDLKAAVTTATTAMLEVVNQLIADEQAEMDDAEMTDSEKGIAQKAGRTLSKKTRTLLENTLAELKNCVAAVDDLLKNADAEGGEGKATAGKADAQNEPTVPQGYAEIKAALKQYSDNREVLRLVATSVSSALERINKNAKK